MEIFTNHDSQIQILIGLGFILLLLGIAISMVLIYLIVTINKEIFIKEEKNEAVGSRVPRMIKVHDGSNFDNYTPPPCNPSDD